MIDNNLPKLPYDRSYWVEPGRVLAGYYPGDLSTIAAEEKLNALFDCGIRSIINLVEEHELASYYPLLVKLATIRQIDVVYQRIPIRDLDVPNRATMVTILDAVDAAVRRNRPVYIHCWGGVGRTGTVVGCYLARQGRFVGDAALARIATLRQNDPKAHRVAPETSVQRDLVRAWRPGE